MIIKDNILKNRITRNIRYKKLVCISMSAMLAAGLVLWDAEIADKALASALDITETPHVIKVGDTELATVGSYSDAEQVIEGIKEAYGENNSASDAVIAPKVTIENIKQDIGEKNPEPDTVEAAIDSILEKNSGDTPIFNVTVETSGLSKVSVPFETETVEDPDMYEGETKVVQEGENGIDIIIGKALLVNGKPVNQETYETKGLKAPVKKIIHKGTKKKKIAKTNSSSSLGITTGSFIWPIPSSHHVASGYGGRVGPIYGNEFHMGLDISGSYGAPIVAADGGRVVEAGWHYSYGYQVVIQHSNGLKTRYAHNSSLNVSVGQRVSKGQVISYCGSTGDSVAPHLHFEVWQGGSHVNPYNYL